ncbi:MAG: DUF4058 family protein [Chloroflexi bacterium]|nr:DUF4058 family protein [Chloroflexota bacterium]
MPSPFPGMDPYLEGYLWPDVHHRLATQISDQLMPLLVPRYVARIVIQTVLEEIETGEAVRVIVPDVEVISGRDAGRAVPQSAQLREAPIITPATVTVPQPLTVEVDIPSVEIRDTASGMLVTSIEILSPTNKRGNGWNEYQIKRVQVLQAQAHLVEIDLLRRGRRHVSTAVAPRAPYYAFLTRAQNRKQVQVWAIPLRERLPTIAVPLRAPDPDVPLDLQSALAAVYDRARYDLSIDYSKPTEPPLDDADAVWAASLQ